MRQKKVGTNGGPAVFYDVKSGHKSTKIHKEKKAKKCEKVLDNRL
jgi:hypothetical protein